MSCVNHNAVHPLCVSELRSSQEDLIRTQWHCAGLRNTLSYRVKVAGQEDITKIGASNTQVGKVSFRIAQVNQFHLTQGKEATFSHNDATK